MDKVTSTQWVNMQPLDADLLCLKVMVEHHALVRLMPPQRSSLLSPLLLSQGTSVTYNNHDKATSIQSIVVIISHLLGWMMLHYCY